MTDPDKPDQNTKHGSLSTTDSGHIETGLDPRTRAIFAELLRVRAERDKILSSTIWRSTATLRNLAERLPSSFRRTVVRGLKIAFKAMRGMRRSAVDEALSVSADAQPTPPTQVPPLAHPQQSGPARCIVFISGAYSSPGHRYRVERPAGAAAVLGIRSIWLKPDDIVGRLDDIAQTDILWVWRAPWSAEIQLAVDTARFGGAQIIFDIDDLVIDPAIAQISIVGGIGHKAPKEKSIRAHYSQMRRSMATADLCVAATEELAGHMRNAGMPTLVLCNGFDRSTMTLSRLAVRRHAAAPKDGLIRIGYAGCLLTHQRDFAVCAAPVADILERHPETRLVVFCAADGARRLPDMSEFSALRGLEDRIEWRSCVSLGQLPDELVRFDVNLAPFEIGNPFRAAKSERKFFEAALVDAPTIASPTGPFRRAIRHGETGMLARTEAEWRSSLDALIEDAALRRRIGAAANLDILWRFGPECRVELLASLVDIAKGGRIAARAFQSQILQRQQTHKPPLRIADHEIAFEADKGACAFVTIIVPTYNYDRYVVEALESASAQDLAALDLVIVEDRSTDNSFEVVLQWAKANAGRFNRIVVARNHANSGLAATRNVGFKISDTSYVLPLDADNRLLPGCASACLRAIEVSGAAFVYPVIEQFGTAMELMGLNRYDPVRLANNNYIDAMALVSRAAWAAAGGYDHVSGGWEDFDFWCRLAELGLRGEQVPGPPLAAYRVHQGSMIRTAISDPRKIQDMMTDLGQRHPWLTLVWPLSEPPGNSRPNTQ